MTSAADRAGASPAQAGAKPADFNLAEGVMRYLILDPPQPEYDFMTCDYDRGLSLVKRWSKLADAKATPVCRTWTRPEQARTRIVCDTELAGAHLGFTAHRVLVDGITEEIGWLRAQLAGAPEMALAASA